LQVALSRFIIKHYPRLSMVPCDRTLTKHTIPFCVFLSSHGWTRIATPPRLVHLGLPTYLTTSLLPINPPLAHLKKNCCHNHNVTPHFFVAFLPSPLTSCLLSCVTHCQVLFETLLQGSLKGKLLELQRKQMVKQAFKIFLLNSYFQNFLK
jgi:hypothetical protein